MTPRLAVVAVLSLVSVTPVAAQVPPATSAATAPLPPATKMEAFKPGAGTAVTFAYTNVGKVATVAVDARQLRGLSGPSVRGLLIEVTQSEYREERSFVDADEIPELLRGIDHILATKTNPAPGFKEFEERYTTRGELQITAYSSGREIRYAISAGRVLKAQTFVDEGDMRKFRDLIVSAQAVLAAAAQP